jgi:hypothetical protein
VVLNIPTLLLRDLSFHDFQFACIELTLMTQGIQPMVWHQFDR